MHACLSPEQKVNPSRQQQEKHTGTSRLLPALALAISLSPHPVWAQTPPRVSPDLPAKQDQLRGLQDTLTQSSDQRRKLENEIELIRNDRARLASALLEATSRVQSTEQRITDVEARLSLSTGSEEAIRRSLDGRRNIISEVLAVLQRMGHKPPPAVLASPEDMVRAIRAAMLMGAVLPELRAEVDVLANDLQDLAKVRRAISAERDVLARDVITLESEKTRLTGLIAARQSVMADVERALESEHVRAADLARQALDLKELIARMEEEISSAGSAAEAARKADETNNRLAALPQDPRPKLSPFRDSGRLAPALAFVNTKGLLPFPASGRLIKTYGAADGFGGTEKGISISTPVSALVASPTDGWIAFSGPYRTYGQLLIINAGGGYYVILAGMTKTNVEVGQFVLAGEPVGTMGDGVSKTASAIAIGASQPVLYIEFRKDGAAVDPSPWWAKSELEKVRG